ncbi:MFS transporter [Streptomyces mangrovisoli]|uniref:MFS transporter n=1 Tax=Streptomyces mangrovisoli TaxID=1428628 RepID=A0A1J4NQZ5_9ACTN|nr:MFS transporter [Streptomyces mangrovisoli]OIJ64747.1 MFS transporter [Streptomyces mangrovisoli]
MSSSPAGQSGAAKQSSTALVLALGLAAMVVAMAQTQVVPILTLLGTTMHTDAAGVSWVTTATLLSAAVFTPLLGRVGDLYGKKHTLVAVLVVMVLGSLLASTTTSLGLLLVGRVMQGSATAIFPLALSIVRDQVPHEKLHGAMALVSSTLAFGSGLSLVVTGLLTQGGDPDYHSVFWFSTGVSLLALVAVLLLVPDGGHRVGGRVDVPGTLVLAAFLVLLLLGISQGHTWGWGSAKVIGCFAGAVLMAAVWVPVELKVAAPLVDMRMFAHRQVAMTNLAGLFVGFASFAQFIGISYLVQMPERLAGYGFTASVLRASVEYLLPGSLIALVAAPVGGILVRRISARTTLAISGLLGAAGFAWLAFGHGSSASVICAGLFTGAAIAFGYAAMPALIAASVPVQQTGIANGINSISRSLGSAIASAVVTSLLASRTISGLPAGIELPQESQFTLSFAIALAVMVLTAAVAVAGLTKERGRSAPIATSVPAAASAPVATSLPAAEDRGAAEPTDEDAVQPTAPAGEDAVQPTAPAGEEAVQATVPAGPVGS